MEEGRARLHALIDDHPDDQIAAYQQLGQSYAETGEAEAARAILAPGSPRLKLEATGMPPPRCSSCSIPWT